MRAFPSTRSRPAIAGCLLLLALGACAPDPGISDQSSNAGAAAAAESLLARYQRAEQMLRPNTSKLVLDNVLARYWQDDDRLLHRKSTAQGSEFLIMDPRSGANAPLFDHVQLAGALQEFSEDDVDAQDLDLTDLELVDSSQALEFDFDDERYRLDLDSMDLRQLLPAPADEFLSPDGSKAAFIDEHNLWLRDTRTDELVQLTFDGVEDYGYATNNAGWLRDDGPVLLWSPDSSRIASFRHDGRRVGEMYLYSTEVGHPQLEAWKYPLPGDENIFMIERLVINLEPEPNVVFLDMPADPHRSTVTDHVAANDGSLLDVQWSEDSSRLAFVSSSRDHKTAQLRLADPDTGAVTDVYSETVPTYYESGYRAANWRVFHERGEFLWFSEQDDWGHLYLHDLASGAPLRQLTSGSWAVLRVLEVDLDEQWIYFLGSNREAGDPYYHYLYRIGLDGSGLVNLTPEPAHHVIDWSESGTYFSDTYSTPTQPPVTVIRNRQGQVLLELEQADIGPLLASGWVAPEPFTVKARDQQTDLYGLMYRPSNFDPAAAYPVLNYLYPGPQTGSVGSRAFQAARGDKQALAELGFIVVEVDAMGTPGRSKSFHDAYYGDMGDNGLPDQVAAIRQLGARHPWMDLERVGIWGHSGGGFASTAAILRYPEFYKVAVSSAGNHDNRNYEDDWGEKWQGLLQTFPEDEPGTAADQPRALTNYDNQANQLLADQLQGKLLLAHGLMDSNVHPSNTLLLVEALIEAEKDFDLVLLPSAGHGFGDSRYFMKRRWDYFVEHLLGLAPPATFTFADNIR